MKNEGRGDIEPGSFFALEGPGLAELSGGRRAGEFPVTTGGSTPTGLFGDKCA